MIKVFYIKSEKRVPFNLINSYLNLLPTEMQQKARRFFRWQDSQAFILGKILLMTGLKEFRFDHDLSKIRYTKYGRPFLENTGDFNLSHSGSHIVCVVSTEGKVGIDVEEVKQIRVNDFKSQFQSEEWTEIMTSKNIFRSFYLYWTAKESIVKADGRGLNIPLKKIFLTNGECFLNESIWYYKNILSFDDCIGHIASDNILIHFDVEYVSLDYLTNKFF